jgi:lysophospholipase L1-like esterase
MYNMNKNTNLFLGSSIISQWDTSHFFPNFQNINLGISGLTSYELKEKYSMLFTDKYTKTKINNIFLYIGSNDVTKNINMSDILNNIVKFITLLQTKFQNTKIYYIAIFKSPCRNTNELKKIDYINNKLRELAMISHKFVFYNFNRQLISKNNFVQDKTHLSRLGYHKLSKCIEKILHC